LIAFHISLFKFRSFVHSPLPLTFVMPSILLSDSIGNLTGRQIKRGRFTLLEELNSGTYGKVYKAIDRKACSDSPPKYWAVKCIRQEPPGSSGGLNLEREITLHKKVSRHRNVVSIHKIVHTRKYIFIVMDLCSGGDLYTAMMSSMIFRQNDPLVKSIFLQLLDAVQHCHEHGVFHRDLKPENILCNKDLTRIYLTDFGLSTDSVHSQRWGVGSSYYMSPGMSIPLSTSTHGLCFAECIGKDTGYQSYCPRVNDVWSLGIIFTNMITGRNPWDRARLTEESYYFYMQDPRYLSSILPMSKEAEAILSRMLDPNPATRASVLQVHGLVLVANTFFMTAEELRRASKHVQRNAAGFYDNLGQQATQPPAEARNDSTQALSGHESLSISTPITDEVSQPGSHESDFDDIERADGNDTTPDTSPETHAQDNDGDVDEFDLDPTANKIADTSKQPKEAQFSDPTPSAIAVQREEASQKHWVKRIARRLHAMPGGSRMGPLV
jgi:serine/threonine protein kinase